MALFFSARNPGCAKLWWYSCLRSISFPGHFVASFDNFRPFFAVSSLNFTFFGLSVSDQQNMLTLQPLSFWTCCFLFSCAVGCFLVRFSFPFRGFWVRRENPFFPSFSAVFPFFLDFLAFFLLAIWVAFLCDFPFLFEDFEGSAKRKPFFQVFPVFFLFYFLREARFEWSGFLVTPVAFCVQKGPLGTLSDFNALLAPPSQHRKPSKNPFSLTQPNRIYPYPPVCWLIRAPKSAWKLAQREICWKVSQLVLLRFLRLFWEKLNRGVSKPGGFPLFFGKGPDCVADPFGTFPCRRCE